MSDTLEELLLRLRDERALFLSGEEAARQGAVLPVLARLGWDRDNIREVVPEYAVGDGRVDYCLKIGEQPSVFVEVKRANEELEFHQKQLLDYSFQHGVKIAVLTNGLAWWFYLPLFETPWEQRKFYVIDIQHQEVALAARQFVAFLSREAVADGSAVKRAEETQKDREKAGKITNALPKAWLELCQEPDELLVELLAEKVEGICGHRPDQDVIAQFLAKVVQETPRVLPGVPPSPRPRAPRDRRAGNYTFRSPLAYSFKGESHSVSFFRDILIGLCRTLYRAHQSDFERVFTLRGRRRASFARDDKGMYGPKEIDNSGIYVETNMSANATMMKCYDLLALFGYRKEDLEVTLRKE